MDEMALPRFVLADIQEVCDFFQSKQSCFAFLSNFGLATYHSCDLGIQLKNKMEPT